MGPERLIEIVSPLRQRFLLVEFQELEQMLEKYIDEKEQLILEINKKKTKFHLKAKMK